jgi:hypothetical protein
MIVRNYLLIVPFIGLLAARGIGDVAGRLANGPAGVPPSARRLMLRGAHAAFLAALGVAAVAQASYLVGAANSIARPDVNADARAAVRYVAGHPRRTYRLSPRVRALAAAQQITLPANITDGAAADAVVFFAIADGPGARRWTTNDPWLTEATFGPREVNFNWYSSWDGRDRIAVMTVDKARAAGVALAR